MNKPSDMLYRLVQGLSPKEATHFKRTLTVYDVAKGKNNFLLLFDALRSLAVFDDAVLRKMLPKGFKLSTLSSLKAQLKRKLLDFLVQHHDSNFAQMHRRLEEIEILLARGFYPEAQELVIETKKLAFALKLKTYLFVVTYFESYLLNYLGGDMLKQIRDISIENAEVSSELSLTYQIGSYLARVFVLQGKGLVFRKQEDAKELKTLISLLARCLTISKLTMHQKINLQQALARAYGIAMETEKCFEQAKILHNLFRQQYDDYKQSDADRAFAIYGDLLGFAYQAKEKETYRKWFIEFERSLQELPSTPMYAEFHLFYQYLNRLFSDSATDKEFGWNTLTALYKENRFANVPVRKTVEEVIVLGHIERQQFEEVAYYINLLIEPAQSTNFFLEQYDFFRVVRLIMLYEQMTVSKTLSYEAFASQVNTVYQRIRKMPKTHDYGIEKAILQCFKNIPALATKQEHIQLLQKLHAALTPLFKKPSVFVKQRTFYFDVLKWVERKISK